MGTYNFDFEKRLVNALATHFGNTCEVVLHDFTTGDREHTIIAIENGEISGRHIGDGPSQIAIEAMNEGLPADHDHLGYLTRTRDGRLLKSTTVFIRDDSGHPVGLIGINTDISLTIAMEQSLHSFNARHDEEDKIETIPTNVTDLLDSLIQQSLKLVGKPASLMDKSEKIRAIHFLSDSGAFLITKSGPKICQVFGISKYTLYSYLDEAKQDSQSDS